MECKNNDVKAHACRTNSGMALVIVMCCCTTNSCVKYPLGILSTQHYYSISHTHHNTPYLHVGDELFM